MNKKIVFGLLLLSLCFFISCRCSAGESDRPNIIFILADDLGYCDLGCYGQQVIQTPHIDQMAKEGMRFRNFYAGSTVCAPSRSVLMTGQHVGLTHVRGNAGGQGLIQTLRKSDTTVAEVLKTKGYQTALCGKWGLGEITKEMPDTPGHPNRQGFDFFFGYLSQLHAHNYYPEFLWQNYSKVPLRNKVVPFGRKNDNWVFKAGYSSRRVDYSHDLIMKKALNFIKDSKDDPFFLYLPVTIPHANNEGGRGIGNGQEIPDYGIYQSQPWSDPDKGQAAMITLLDTGVGQIMTLLKELDIDENTLVMFSSDNGHHDEGGHNTETFDPNGPLRGMKRDLYEGGIRVPLIVRWPGKIKPGTVSDHIASFSDFMATAADLSGAEIPEHTTSISFLPTLVDQSTRQEQHEFLYWEFYERGGKQAVRSGNWKAVRMPMFTGRIQLFDLKNDLGEANDVASQHPEIVERMTFLMAKGHHPHPNWNAKGKAAKNPPVPGDGQPRF